MNGESEELKPQVREYAGPTILIGIVILAGLGIGLIWGLDPRWLYSASVAFVLALVLAAASDGRRRERAFQAARKARDEARYEAAREALDGPFGQAVHEFGSVIEQASWVRKMMDEGRS
jgi:hypothetical protein